jgi:hypothetical protein
VGEDIYLGCKGTTVAGTRRLSSACPPFVYCRVCSSSALQNFASLAHLGKVLIDCVPACTAIIFLRMWHDIIVEAMLYAIISHISLSRANASKV